MGEFLAFTTVFIGIPIALFITIAYIAIIPAEFAKIAQEKGYSYGLYWFYVFVFGIAGMLLVIALPKKDNNCKSVPKTSQCPKCRASIKAGDLFCINCGVKLT